MIKSLLEKSWEYILIYLFYGSLRISHQVPINVCGARKMSVYLEAACPILGPIVMALVKLEGFQTDAHNVKKQLTRVPSFLPLLCSKVKTSQRPKTDQLLVTSTQQKSLITKLSITSYLCGFYVKQSLGPVLKTHIFELPFTTVNLDQSCSNVNGQQPLGASYIWTYKRPCSIA